MRVIRIGEAQTFFRPALNLPEDGAVKRFFSDRQHVAMEPSYVAVIDGGRVWGYAYGCVFTRDGSFIPAFSRDPWGAKMHGVWLRSKLPEPVRVPGRVLYLVTPEAGCNYHHWLLDLLPRIGAVERAGFALGDFDRIVINHANLAFQWETLERLGVPRSRVFTINQSVCWQADQLVVPSLLASNEFIAAESVQFLRDRLPSKQAVVGASRRLFLSRRDASARRLVNESEIERLVHRYGFETIVLSGLSVARQAQIFSEAEMIMGSGAGLANLVFAPTHARVIELASPRWLTVYHWMLSARLGVDHTLVLANGDARAEAASIRHREKDFSIDPQKLQRVLDALERSYVSGSASSYGCEKL